MDGLAMGPSAHAMRPHTRRALATHPRASGLGAGPFHPPAYCLKLTVLGAPGKTVMRSAAAAAVIAVA
jgi:hypothetical protein